MLCSGMLESLPECTVQVNAVYCFNIRYQPRFAVMESNVVATSQDIPLLVKVDNCRGTFEV